MNIFACTARLGKDAEIRYMANGDPVVSCTAAVTSGYGEKAITTWLNCSMFGKRFEKVSPFLKKGVQVAISGEITNRPYTDKSGNEKYSLDLRVNDLTLIGGKPAEDKPKRAEREPGGGGGSFDDMEDDIPFITASPYYDITTSLQRRMYHYGR